MYPRDRIEMNISGSRAPQAARSRKKGGRIMKESALNSGGILGTGESKAMSLQQPAVKKAAPGGGRLFRGISNLAMSIWDTSWCQSEVQFFNDHCRKKLLGRW